MRTHPTEHRVFPFPSSRSERIDAQHDECCTQRRIRDDSHTEADENRTLYHGNTEVHMPNNRRHLQVCTTCRAVLNHERPCLPTTPRRHAEDHKKSACDLAPHLTGTRRETPARLRGQKAGSYPPRRMGADCCCGPPNCSPHSQIGETQRSKDIQKKQPH